jgi:hypothetical protein
LVSSFSARIIDAAMGGVHSEARVVLASAVGFFYLLGR